MDVSKMDFSSDKIMKKQGDCINYFLQFVCDNLFLPGQVENWVIIEDLTNINILDLPL